MQLEKESKVIIALLLIAGAAIVSAATTYVYFTQHLVVPQTKSFAVSRDIDGALPVTAGDDLTQYWFWYQETHSFNLTLYIKNDGNMPLNIGVTCTGLAANWTFSYSSTANLNNLLVGDIATVNFSVYNVNAYGGEDLGNFTVTIAAA